jgi:hypothetical protein
VLVKWQRDTRWSAVLDRSWTPAMGVRLLQFRAGSREPAQCAVVKLLWDTCQSRNRGALTSPVGHEIPRVALALSGIGEIRNRCACQIALGHVSREELGGTDKRLGMQIPQPTAPFESLCACQARARPFIMVGDCTNWGPEKPSWRSEGRRGAGIRQNGTVAPQTGGRHRRADG